MIPNLRLVKGNQYDLILGPDSTMYNMVFLGTDHCFDWYETTDGETMVRVPPHMVIVRESEDA